MGKKDWELGRCERRKGCWRRTHKSLLKYGRRIEIWEGVREGKDVGDEVTKAFWSAEEGLRIGKDLGEDTKVFWSEEEELRIGKDVGEDTKVFWSREEGLGQSRA